MFQFIKAVEMHAAVRALGTPSGIKIECKIDWDGTYEGYNDVSYWVCAYS